jgi:hypothetical protein
MAFAQRKPHKSELVSTGKKGFAKRQLDDEPVRSKKEPVKGKDVPQVKGH